ncbi:hypothetical protein B9G73_13350 [Bordetella bronchiseptica]|nr:hypothetical protein B9G73_13350 [Bordetella bronchiseptica]
MPVPAGVPVPAGTGTLAAAGTGTLAAAGTGTLAAAGTGTPAAAGTGTSPPEPAAVSLAPSGPGPTPARRPAIARRSRPRSRRPAGPP